jgi:hypothetical protein
MYRSLAGFYVVFSDVSPISFPLFWMNINQTQPPLLLGLVSFNKVNHFSINFKSKFYRASDLRIDRKPAPIPNSQHNHPKSHTKNLHWKDGQKLTSLSTEKSQNSPMCITLQKKRKEKFSVTWPTSMPHFYIRYVVTKQKQIERSMFKAMIGLCY